MFLLPSEQSHKGSIILRQWRRSTISSPCIRWTPHDEINHRFMRSCGKVSEGKALPGDQGTEAFPLAWPHPLPWVCSSLLAEPKRCPQKMLLKHFTALLRSLYLLMLTSPLLMSYRSDDLLSRKETLFLSALLVLFTLSFACDCGPLPSLHQLCPFWMESSHRFGWTGAGFEWQLHGKPVEEPGASALAVRDAGTSGEGQSIWTSQVAVGQGPVPSSATEQLWDLERLPKALQASTFFIMNIIIIMSISQGCFKN